jgi:hypothetical protein
MAIRREGAMCSSSSSSSASSSIQRRNVAALGRIDGDFFHRALAQRLQVFQGLDLEGLAPERMIDPSSGDGVDIHAQTQLFKAMDFNISNSGLMPVAGDRTGSGSISLMKWTPVLVQDSLVRNIFRLTAMVTEWHRF